MRKSKLNIIALYHSAREISIYNCFVCPLIELSRRKHTVHLITLSRATSSSQSLIFHTVKKIHFPVIPSIPFLLESFARSLGLLKKDINLFLCFQVEDLALGWFLKKLKKDLSLVYYAHGDGTTVQELTIRSAFDKIKFYLSIMLEKVFLPKVNLIITVSLDTKLRILNRVKMNPNKIKVVYNNVTPASPKSTQTLHELKEKSTPIIGFVGHIEPLKGVETLLKAFYILCKHNSKAVLVYVGDGSLTKYLKNLAMQMNLQKRIIFTGWVKNPLDYMCDFNVLVLPSLYEGCPLVILEAFSLNIPVLGSKSGGIPELLEDEELLFQSANPEELASRVETLLSSNEKYVHANKIVMEKKKYFTFDRTSMIEKLFLNSMEKQMLEPVIKEK